MMTAQSLLRSKTSKDEIASFSMSGQTATRSLSSLTSMAECCVSSRFNLELWVNRLRMLGTS